MEKGQSEGDCITLVPPILVPEPSVRSFNKISLTSSAQSRDIAKIFKRGAG